MTAMLPLLALVRHGNDTEALMTEVILPLAIDRLYGQGTSFASLLMTCQALNFWKFMTAQQSRQASTQASSQSYVTASYASSPTVPR